MYHYLGVSETPPESPTPTTDEGLAEHRGSWLRRLFPPGRKDR